MSEPYRTLKPDPSVTNIGCGLPNFSGGIEWGNLALVETWNRDGTTTRQARRWRDGAWHDQGPAEILPKIGKPEDNA